MHVMGMRTRSDRSSWVGVQLGTVRQVVEDRWEYDPASAAWVMTTPNALVEEDVGASMRIGEKRTFSRRVHLGSLDPYLHNLTLVVDAEGVLPRGSQNYTFHFMYEGFFSQAQNHSTDWDTAGWQLGEDGSWHKVLSCPARSYPPPPLPTGVLHAPRTAAHTGTDSCDWPLELS